MNHMKAIRRLSQAAALLGFIALFLAARFPFRPWAPVDLGLRFSPFGAVLDSLAGLKPALHYGPGIVILLLTPFFGRFFCGWLCPLGAMLDGWRRLFGPKAGESASSVPGLLRWPKYALLAFLSVATVAGGPFWGWFDPLALFNRLVTGVGYPLTTYIMSSISSILTWIPGFIGFKRSIAKWLMPEAQFVPWQFWSLFALGAVILVLEFRRPRFWCRSVCPAGALLGICASHRLHSRRIDESCVNCGRCSRECPMAAVEERPRQVNPAECIECRLCDSVCPPGTSAIVRRFQAGSPVPAPVDLTRRHLIGSATCGLAMAAGERILPQKPLVTTGLLRPPGAIDEESFRRHCIRCLQCVRVCASNGACLQPDGLENGVSGLWAPVAKMRTGYCEANCNLCGQVCPTGVIRKMSLDDKYKHPIGRAVFDKNFCIPHRRNEDCLVCEEHCPVPDKAIRFELREATAPDGTKRMIKYPYVVADKCIGCGICEHKCPLPGRPGIFVSNERAH